jgi:hypothetical protein
MEHLRLAILLAGALALVGCSKQPAAQPAPERLYQVSHSAPAMPVNFVHKTFKVDSYAKFEFEVPAHTVSPKLQGNFSVSSATVDLLLLTPEQFADFTRGAGEPTYSVLGSSGRSVDFVLAPTTDEAQKYYLVFNNPARGSARGVQADFTVSF